MDRKKFNPTDWLKEDKSIAAKRKPNGNSDNLFIQIEALIKIVEEQRLDITAIYTDWRNIGFAFADEFGEAGRDLFHRISQFCPSYTPEECDKHFNHYLKSKGKGITIRTVFYLLKKAGIQLNIQKSNTMNLNDSTNTEVSQPINGQLKVDEGLPEEMPTFPEPIFSNLPDLLMDVIKYASSNEERDILLLGSIVCFSACLPNLYGIYDNRKVFSNLFLYVIAKASAGKGKLENCRKLVYNIHKQLRNEAKLIKKQYEDEMAEFLQQKGKKKSADKPAKPPEKMLFIPANNSSTGAYQLLDDNEGKGLIFETEGDTLAQAFKTDYGNYSDGFRKAFHHETISYYRRTDREFVEIPNPCLSTLLSATFKQVPALIPSAENGLFSRFIFYCMNMGFTWKDVFAKPCDQGLDEYFDSLGKRFYELYEMLCNSSAIQFSYTAEQEEKFNSTFSKVQEAYLLLQGEDYMATVRRLGLITFRISMILSALRILETGEIKQKIICEDRDFDIAMSMMKILIKHSAKVFSELPVDEKPTKRKNRKERFLDILPARFNRQGFLKAAKECEIIEKTAEGYITAFIKAGILHRDAQDVYMKVFNENFKAFKEVKVSPS